MSTNGAICKRLAKTTGKATTDVTSYMSTKRKRGKKFAFGNNMHAKISLAGAISNISTKFQQ